ncbi:hypothetical protein [Mesorhizobium comanense]|uniref:hypothetical protein n=1 Tax=Mesorhizobium comanense TaxID=2502215 RepID=UPI0010F5A365|nr:hypothetical protein [Mesorhizobium comanense]
MISSLFRLAERWAPATRGENGEPLFTVDLALELAELHVSDDRESGSESDRLKQVLQNPELRLAFELVPEIIAEHALRKLSAPKDFEYVLCDRHGRGHGFKVATHPIAQLIHEALARDLLPAPTVQTVGKASSYADAVSRALNAGEKLADLTVCVAPIGLGLHRGKLEIR